MNCLRYFNFSNNIDLNKEKINLIVLEEQHIFYKFCNDLYCCADTKNIISAFEAYEKIELSKYSTFIHNYHELDPNNKEKITLLTKQAASLAIKNEISTSLKIILREYNNIASIIKEEIDLDYIYTDTITLQQLIKIMDFKFNIEGDKLLDCIISLLKIYFKLTDIRYIFFSNLSTYLNEKEIFTVFEYCQKNDSYLILIENKDILGLDSNKFIVDMDLCEIIS